MNKLIKLALVACALTTGTGCVRGFDIETPDGFAELDQKSSYGYRATSAKGVVLGVRREVNDPKGDLDFWSGAIDAQLRRRGYNAVTGEEVKSADGIDGRQIRYTISRNGRSHAFWMSVFVTDDAVVTIEAGGDEAFFEEQEKTIEHAIKSVSVI